MSTYRGYRFPLKQARGIRMLVLDVDGVLTRGDIIMRHDGQEIKAFNVRDGHGIKMLQRAGIEVAIITGRTSQVVAARARDLGIDHCIQGCLDKSEGLQRLLETCGLAAEDCAFMGDDIIDLLPMRRCRLALAPSDAHLPVRRSADWVSGFRGGEGAVRQAAEALILANGAWRRVIEDRYGVAPEACGWEV